MQAGMWHKLVKGCFLIMQNNLFYDNDPKLRYNTGTL